LITVIEAEAPTTLVKVALKLRLPPPWSVLLMQNSWALADWLPVTTIAAAHRTRVTLLMLSLLDPARRRPARRLTGMRVSPEGTEREAGLVKKGVNEIDRELSRRPIDG
jgi:hypothetical protein